MIRQQPGIKKNGNLRSVLGEATTGFVERSKILAEETRDQAAARDKKERELAFRSW